MSDQDKHLCRMGNQIADYFQSYPDEQAVAGIHDHIFSFWTPKMREKLKASIAAGTEGLNPLLITAMQRPGRAKNPAAKEAAGPLAVGEIGASDAG